MTHYSTADRLFIATEVTRRMNYIQHDAVELARLLRGERMSAGTHEALMRIIKDLERIAETADPRPVEGTDAPATAMSPEKADAA